MTFDAIGATNLEGITAHTLNLFKMHLSELSTGIEFLPDKPEETATSTLVALWHAASGKSVSVQRAATEALSDLDARGVAELRSLVRNRINGTPLAYLTGRQQFMGLDLIATTDALIPRRETEVLGYAALEQLRAIVRQKGHAKVIDVCTGSGNLALALAWHEPRAHVWAADLSGVAISLACRNLKLLELDNRVEFRTGDLLQPFDFPQFHGAMDMVICNPPYMSSGKVDCMPREIIDYEPRLAFDGGPLGIQILLRLISEAQRYLCSGGWLAFEIGLGQGPGIRKRIEQLGDYVDVREIIDEHGQIRAFFARMPT